MGICNAERSITNLPVGPVNRGLSMALVNASRTSATLKKAMLRSHWMVLLLGAVVLSGRALTPRRPPPPNLINDAAPEGCMPDTWEAARLKNCNGSRPKRSRRPRLFSAA